MTINNTLTIIIIINTISIKTMNHTEASANDPFSVRHAERPQHSLSCSNIVEVRGGFREDDGSEPIVFATIKHGQPDSAYSQVRGRSQQKERPRFSSLHRGHSRSYEGPLQTNDIEHGGGERRAPRLDHGPLYKTASLSRSLAFSEENILLGASGGPKRAVSSSQLPGKGILKNKEPSPDIRKAKSMEVLSPRVAKGQGQSEGKGKGVTQAEIEKAKDNFVQGKLQFSAFLDEITKQVISPSHLSILGVNNLKATGKTSAPAQASGPAKPQLPPKKHKESSGEEREQQPIQHSTQEKPARSNPHSNHRKHSDHSNPDKLISYAARNHSNSPPPIHHPQSTSHHPHPGGSQKDRRPSPTETHVARDRCSRYGPYLTDGTSTSPEPIMPKQRHHHKHRPAASQGLPQHAQHFPQTSPHQGHPDPGQQGAVHSPSPPALVSRPGPEVESPSSKSDSSRTRDIASTATSQSSEQSGQHRLRATHMGYPKLHRDTLCDVEQFMALQEENADLHQNLLQTVVCIESLEAELQRTREELSHVKDQYKSLLETHTGTRQANNLLGEHLHIASESLSSERKYLINRIAQLSSELEDAHRTIAALETINVPYLLKELLEKHFDSAEALQKFLKTATPISHSETSPKVDNQSHALKVVELPHDWLEKSEAGQQRATAFMPWKQETPTTGSEDHPSDLRGSSSSPPFSVADISTAIYKKMAAGYADSPRPFHPQHQKHPSLATNHTDTPPGLHQSCLVRDGRGGMGEGGTHELEQGVGDVTRLSSQQVLDDFMHQLQPHKEGGRRKEQEVRQEWLGGAGEETGRVTE
ncbi:uncharacterized protein ACJ7VT_006113 [Polymixia lowei]